LSNTTHNFVLIFSIFYIQAIATPAGANCAGNPCVDADHDTCCTPAANFFINSAGTAVAHTTCGKQVAVSDNAAVTRLTGASTTVAGTCAACAASTYSITDAGNCLANTVCGNLAAGGTRAVGDADRTTAGTCTACAAGSFGINNAANCVIWTVCGNQDGAAGTRVETVAGSLTVDRTCTPCVSGFFAALGSENCVVHATPTCGNQLGLATRLVAGTTTKDAFCADCADNTFAANAAANCYKKMPNGCTERSWHLRTCYPRKAVDDYFQDYRHPTSGVVITKLEFNARYSKVDYLGIQQSYTAGTKAEVLETYGPIGQWDMSEVTVLSYLFWKKATVNADLSNWNVSQVTSLSSSK
jgi:hypothetical protein